MNRHRSGPFVSDTDEAVAPAGDVLSAVSGAFRGDRKSARQLIAKTKGRIEKRLRRKLLASGLSQPTPAGKKRKIHGARLAPPEHMQPMAPPGAVEARLPNGRKVRLAVARHHDMLALRQTIGANTKRTFDAIAHHSRAIDQLAASQQELSDRLAKLESNGDLFLLRGIVDGLAHLEKRMEGIKRYQDKALNTQRRVVQKQFARQAHVVKAQTRNTQIQKLHGTVMSAQAVAYGTKGNLLAMNNLVLAVNQLLGNFAAEILQALGLSKPGETSHLNWLAPLGGLVATQVVLGRRQHERFVSGIMSDFEVLAAPPVAMRVAMVRVVHNAGGSRFGVKKISLEKYIAPAEWDHFKRRKNVPVTTVVLEPRSEIEPGIWSSGEVHNGELTVRITALGQKIVQPDVIVSWTVDTRSVDG